MSDTAARFRQGKRPERNGLHGATVVLSLVLHLLGFGAAVGLPRLIPRRAPGDPVYVVDLVSLPPGAASRSPAAPQPTPARRTAAPPPKAAPSPPPKADKPIKVPERTTPKEPAVQKPEVKKPEPKPAEPKPPEQKPVAQPPVEPGQETAEAVAGAATDPSSAPGVAAATGGVGVSVPVGGSGAAGRGASDEYTFYLSLLDRNIRRAWSQPIYTGIDLKTATVSLELSRSGRILNLELLTPSGYDPLDRSVIRAVRDAAPFPPFPHFLGLDTLTVQIVFELDPGGVGAGSSGE